jgi:hypothetical protein
MVEVGNRFYVEKTKLWIAGQLPIEKAGVFINF